MGLQRSQRSSIQVACTLYEYDSMFLHSMCYVVGVRVVAYIIICIYGAPKHMQSCQFLFQVSSGHQEIDDINRFRVPENLEKRDMTVHYVDGSGKNRICGGSDLKGSQAYPVQTFVSRADMFLVSFPRKHQSNFFSLFASKASIQLLCTRTDKGLPGQIEGSTRSCECQLAIRNSLLPAAS